MLSPKFHQHLQTQLNAEITSIAAVSGGDINAAWKLQTQQSSFFIKTNDLPQAESMFAAEAAGIHLLSTGDVIRTPRVVARDSFERTHYLILEYLPPSSTNPTFWTAFGQQLALLHQQSSQAFGLETDNFIGSLPQSNRRHATWAVFYALERLLPQAEMATQQGLLQTKDREQLNHLLARLPELLPTEPPALIHGDLWSGNFICTDSSVPVLIDPSAYYGHREMDLAMARLFGGFHRDFYRAYDDLSPLEPGFESRLPLYQLYYLLVHLNLFGSGYYRSVAQVLQQFGQL
jgi:protein-ribulosamine 3-kinase